MRSIQPKTDRRSSRHTVKISCQVVRERDFRLLADRILDLSNTGMLVGPADPALTGERLIVSFCLPNSSLWIDVEASVTRVVHGRRPGEYMRALALEFDELDGFSKLMLAKALTRIPPAPPRPRPGRRRMEAAMRALVLSQNRVARPYVH
jgi:hypothetical protein